MASERDEWVVGYQDEVWWSRLARPQMHAWSEESKPLRLVELTRSKTDKQPKALCCYGLLRDDLNKVLLRFVDGRAVSAVTVAYLEWVCERLAQEGKRVLVLVWDNAKWHVSKEVVNWIRLHNQRALRRRRQGRAAIQVIPCWLPVKSPWLNPIEPRWIHGKRNIVEPTRTLTAQELAERVCSHFHCEHFDHLKQQVS